jgi:hypothetical protein
MNDCPPRPHYHLYHPGTYDAPRDSTSEPCDFNPFSEQPDGSITSELDGNVRLVAHLEELKARGLATRFVVHRMKKKTGLRLLAKDQVVVEQ